MLQVMPMRGSSRETDRTDAGEVVIDGSRAVAVIGTDLLDAGNGSGLVAAKADELLHILNGHLDPAGHPTWGRCNPRRAAQPASGRSLRRW